jgi:uncharacterized protein (DUF983 family)
VNDAAPATFGKRLMAVVRLRCPRCCEGRIFRGRFAMNDPCPVCGLVFQREEGYFLGAMYVSYVLGAVLLGAFYLLAEWLLPGWNSLVVVLAAVALYLPFVPAVFRYSRGIWIHFERWGSPGDVSAGAWERDRQRRLDG